MYDPRELYLQATYGVLYYLKDNPYEGIFFEKNDVDLKA